VFVPGRLFYPNIMFCRNDRLYGDFWIKIDFILELSFAVKHFDTVLSNMLHCFVEDHLSLRDIILLLKENYE
jgi:hypothetical protein